MTAESTGLRRRMSEVENDLIDELRAGHIGRREFLRHGTVLGMSAPCSRGWPGRGNLGSLVRAQAARAATAGTVRVARRRPRAPSIPSRCRNPAGVIMLCQTGEYLAISAGDLRLRPVLAESWKPNQDGSVWTFKLRQGVKFHNGKTMSADDVVATIDRLADPKNASNALSAFSGVLSKGGTKKVDDYTVEFHLDAPNGNFPYYVSSDNYNTIILPADYAGDFEKNFIGTGPFKLEKYTPKAGASFLRNRRLLGPEGAAGTDRVQLLRRHPGPDRGVAGPDGGCRCPGPRAAGHGAAERSEGEHHQPAIERPYPGAYAHRHGALHESGCAARSRSAWIARSWSRACSAADRTSATTAPSRPSIPRPIPRCHSATWTSRQAKQLMAAAGNPDGFKVKLTTEKFIEIPEYCQYHPAGRRPIGDHHRSQCREPGRLLRQGGLRPVGLARFGDGRHRLRPSRRAERPARRTADQRRHLELGAFQEQGI